MNQYPSELQVAIDAVRVASMVCDRVQKDLAERHQLTKSDRSPVTVADFGSQAVIHRFLREAFPDDPIVAEEDSAALRDPDQAGLVDSILGYLEPDLPLSSPDKLFELIDHANQAPKPGQRFWTLDPIDGTKGFIRGDQYAVALALIEDGAPVVGVLGCPNLPATGLDGKTKGVILNAVQGRGSESRTLDGANVFCIQVSQGAEPADIAFCESVESGHSAHGDSEKIANLLGIVRDPVRIDSQAKYAVIARGDAGAYLRLPTRKDYREKIWDHAAGALVVQEAGGTITDITGKPLDFSKGETLADNRGVVASNGKVHDQLIAAIRTVCG